jgi:DNA polymerase III subunit epsilon
MANVEKETFVCFDCESTGLDPKTDSIIEIAIVKFTFDGEISSYETLIDPCRTIPPESTKIHNITDEMVKGKPKIQEVLPEILSHINGHIVVGHSVTFDIDILLAAAQKHCAPTSLSEAPFIDTLRLARLYGQSPVNSLEKLREHFNIPAEGAHRAMNDVRVNIGIFKYLSNGFRTSEAILERLKKPVALRLMPLGKHRGRPFKEVPQQYLSWAANQDFDRDLLFSIRSELKKRKNNPRFNQVSSPFADL